MSKYFILILFLSLIVFNPVLVVQAQADPENRLPEYTQSGTEQSIKDYLCAPSEPSDGQDLTRCVNRLYRFGISFGAIALVFFIVFAGYLYISGGETGKGKAKGILQNAFTGMAVLLGSYVLLYFINPSLVTFKPIQTPIFSAAALATCADLGFGDDCVIASPGGAQGNYSGSGNGSIVEVAAREIGKGESGGNNRGPEIEKYFTDSPKCASIGAPWCACFATWVYHQAGVKSVREFEGRAATLQLVNFFKSKKGQKVAEGTVDYMTVDEIKSGSRTPMPGDLALFDRGTVRDAFGHTTIVEAYDPSTKKIAIIEGNATPKVRRSQREIDCPKGPACDLIGVGGIRK